MVHLILSSDSATCIKSMNAWYIARLTLFCFLSPWADAYSIEHGNPCRELFGYPVCYSVLFRDFDDCNHRDYCRRSHDAVLKYIPAC